MTSQNKPTKKVAHPERKRTIYPCPHPFLLYWTKYTQSNYFQGAKITIELGGVKI